MEIITNMEDSHTPPFMLLEGGNGQIQAGPDQQDRLNEIGERLLGGEFYVSTNQTIPSQCIDGRVGAEGIAPNAAGGTETIMVADDLTYKRFSTATTLESYANIINHLQSRALPIGGHTDETATEPNSGCGANDKVNIEYDVIATRGDEVRSIALLLGVDVDDATHVMITANAGMRTNFSPGSELLTVLQTADESSVDVLQGSHKEVFAVINTEPQTTLNRRALEAEFGSEYEAFNIDVWAFPEAAAAVAETVDQIPRLVAGMVYFNIAVALTLCGPEMRVGIRKGNTALDA